MLRVFLVHAAFVLDLLCSHAADVGNSAKCDATVGSGACKEASLPFFSLGKEAPLKIQGPKKKSVPWQGLESIGFVPHPMGVGNRSVRLVQSLLDGKEIEALMKVAQDPSPSMRLDSVDSLPEFQVDLMRHGKGVHKAEKTFRHLIKDRIEAYVRDRYQCVECVVCHALVRRYVPGERRGHPSHFDGSAYITAVADLNPEDHVGGLFLQRGEHIDSREYVALRRGDLVVHQYDLNHGVHVEQGSRYSAIFWIVDNKQACKKGTSRWYVRDANRGNADAQYNLGMLHRVGAQGIAFNPTASVNWLTKAAEQGHATAQQILGSMIIDGHGTQRDGPLGLTWVRKAAEQGHLLGQATLGMLYKKGDAGLEPSEHLAISWYQKAAEQNFADAQFQLGMLLKSGDHERAASWFQKAAEQNHQEAQMQLGHA